MSEKSKCCCQKPKEMKGKPQDCRPEQVQKCHGEAKSHPCTEKSVK
ncbi:MAG: hypothetical protein BWZ10_00092 [candidate division BRC1 bacterium ADurb.BinA364]|nr:MAG: hypothetical protein BWZ10_00092 [candidate division BRC1 bacterium ADurb.BinA364]